MKPISPGPWYVGDPPFGGHVVNDSVTIAEVYEPADRVLMAAAPDLLAACELALQHICDDIDTFQMERAVLVTAVAKARGR